LKPNSAAAWSAHSLKLGTVPLVKIRLTAIHRPFTCASAASALRPDIWVR
jgi:hypothetical protein